MAMIDAIIKDLSSALEDVSIKEDGVIPKDEFVLVDSGDQISTEIDLKMVQLLELIDQYEVLTNGDYRLNFINGSLNLSRANYNTGLLSKKFGPESYDLRSYNACKTIEVIKGHFKLVDNLKIQKEKDLLESEKKTDKTVQSTEIEVKESEPTSTTTNLAKPTSLKNRKQLKKQKDNTITTTDEQLNKLKDPITQFGGLVPYQLRQSQQFFQSWLENAMTIVNLQSQINKLVADITEQEVILGGGTDK